MDLRFLPTINADRVSLRRMTERDVDSLYTIFSDAEVMRYWSSPPMKDRAEAEKLLAETHADFNRRLALKWGIALNIDDTIIGTSTLFHLDSSNQRAEIGYALGRAHWGKGYAQEALKALLGYAFGVLDLQRIEADVDPRNAASIRTLERLGFQKEGYLRERWRVGGEIQDALFYGLLRREWNRA